MTAKTNTNFKGSGQECPLHMGRPTVALRLIKLRVLWISPMSLTKAQALELFESDDLIGIGMEADAVRRRLHPEGVVTYIIDRNINYTNFCTEYCTFCAFYRPLKGPSAKEG